MPYQRSLRLDNILVIDDDSQILDTIRCFLQHVGYEVATAGSGEEGIRLLDSGGQFYDAIPGNARKPTAWVLFKILLDFICVCTALDLVPQR